MVRWPQTAPGAEEGGRLFLLNAGVRAWPPPCIPFFPHQSPVLTRQGSSRLPALGFLPSHVKLGCCAFTLTTPILTVSNPRTISMDRFLYIDGKRASFQRLGAGYLPYIVPSDIINHDSLCHSPEHQDGPRRWTGCAQFFATKGTYFQTTCNILQNVDFFSPNENNNRKTCLLRALDVKLKCKGPGVQANFIVHLLTRRPACQGALPARSSCVLFSCPNIPGTSKAVLSPVSPASHRTQDLHTTTLPQYTQRNGNP